MPPRPLYCPHCAQRFVIGVPPDEALLNNICCSHCGLAIHMGLAVHISRAPSGRVQIHFDDSTPDQDEVTAL